MLTECSNPPCSARFRSLEDGRLFRLESDPAVPTNAPKPVEYYWLCKGCASTLTLRLGDHGNVTAVALPPPLQGVPDFVIIALVDRDVASRFPTHGNRSKSRFTIRDDAA